MLHLSSRILCYKIKSIELYNHFISRNFQRCVCCNSSNREAKVLVKIMKGSANPKKSHWYKDNYDNNRGIVETTSGADFLGTSGGGKPSSKRRNVLNKLFMRHITDQMANDDLINGRGVQVSRIQVSPDLRAVNVYWLCDATVASGAYLPTLLDSYAHSLRHQLSRLKIVGRVPPIRFIADHRLALGENVDRLLVSADMGVGEEVDFDDAPQQVPAEWLAPPPDSMHSDGTERLPAMRNDVLGLDQAEIMSKVRRMLKKSCTTSLIGERVIATITTPSLDTINAEIAQFREQRGLRELGRQMQRPHQVCKRREELEAWDGREEEEGELDELSDEDEDIKT